MKFKASKKTGSVVLEIGPEEEQLPAIALPELGIKHILVPTDFSESARKALGYATAFARQFSAELLLLHVVELVMPPPEVIIPDIEALDLSMRESAAKRLSEWRESVVSKATSKAVVRNGTPHREIVKAAEECNIDLIVLGTRGRTGLAHVLLGSTAERVMRYAPCPVLVVREREHDFVQTEGSEAQVSS